MAATKGNGLEAARDQPAKTNTKDSPNFIATVKEFVSGFYLDKSIDAGFILCCLVLLVQAALMAAPGIFQGIDWAGLVALGGVMSTPNTTPAVFVGTSNPRHLRVIQALMTRPLPREQLDKVAGCSNGPELVAELRRRGLEVPCPRTKKKDRDLFDCWPGVYHFTPKDRRLVIQWISKRNAGGNHA